MAQCNPTQLPYAIRAYHKQSKEKMGLFYSRLIEVVEHKVTTIKEDQEEGSVKSKVTSSPRSGGHKKRPHQHNNAKHSSPKHAAVPEPVIRKRLDSHTSSHHSHSPSTPISPDIHRRNRSRSSSFEPNVTKGSVSGLPKKDSFVGDQVDIEVKGVGEIGLDVYWIYIKVS